MLRPVLDPVLSREILARYTTFAGSVGAPAPMEHLAPAGQAAPPRYETYVENLYEVTNLLRKNTVLNLQWDLRFVALRLASAIEQAGRTRTPARQGCRGTGPPAPAGADGDRNRPAGCQRTAACGGTGPAGARPGTPGAGPARRPGEAGKGNPTHRGFASRAGPWTVGGADPHPSPDP